MNNFIKSEILSDSNLQDSEADVKSMGDENSVMPLFASQHKSEQYYIFSDEDKTSELIPV